MANIQKKQQINKKHTKNLEKRLKNTPDTHIYTHKYILYLHISSFFSTETFIYFKIFFNFANKSEEKSRKIT